MCEGYRVALPWDRWTEMEWVKKRSDYSALNECGGSDVWDVGAVDHYDDGSAAHFEQLWKVALRTESNQQPGSGACTSVCVWRAVKYGRMRVKRYLLSQDQTCGKYVCESDPGADGSPELIYPHRCGGRPVGNPSNCCRGIERGALL